MTSAVPAAFLPGTAILVSNRGRAASPPSRLVSCNLRPRVADFTARVASVTAAALLLSTHTAPSAAALNDVLVFDHDQTLVGADFSGREDLTGAIFSKSNCTRANFSRANLKNAQLDDTVLIEAVLDDADCSNVLATRAKLTKSSLKNAVFTNANLVAAQLGGADVTGADFTDALVDPATAIKLCISASGTNPRTGVSTRESLMCREE